MFFRETLVLSMVLLGGLSLGFGMIYAEEKKRKSK
jgi:hypothetical protein